MNKLFNILLATSIACLAAQPSQATIWRLNNSNGGTITPAINASFPTSTTLQQAHDNSSVLSGDTIQVEQSSTSYGPLTMTKKLVIIGAGYFLSSGNTKTQVNKSYGSTVGDITMNASTCAGSTITGLTIAGTVYAGASHLLISRNYFTAPSSSVYDVLVGPTTNTTIDSVVITQNYMVASSYYVPIAVQGTSGSLTNCIITNNYVGLTYYYTNSIVLDSRISGLLKNNVIGGAISVYNMYVVNNMTTGSVTNYFYNCLIEYNLGASANCYQSPSGSGNTITASTNLVGSMGFVSSPSSTDSTYALTSSSPAKGTGKSGEDMGMYGGPLPYVASGIATVPNIYALTISPVAAGATSISVSVSTKSN